MLDIKCFVACLLFLAVTGIHCYTAHSADPLAQQQNDKIDRLPGQSFNISFSQYSGYVTVDEEAGRNLFYWLTESADEPSSKPLVLWLNGGPGCSSIAYGEAEEIGPFHIQADGKSLYLNPYAWNQVANILFLDSPAGVGYSYSKNESDYENFGDKKTAEDSLKFLLKWIERFPQYKGRDFFLTGESYAGHYVPQLSQAIVKHNLATNDTSINIKGYMVGNALTDDFHDHLGLFDFIWSNGLISDDTYRLLNQTCVKDSFIHISGKCGEVLQIADDEMGNIDQYSIFTPPCLHSHDTMSANQLMKRALIGTVSDKYDPCTESYSREYFNLPEVRKALHVHPEAAQPSWDTCNNIVNAEWWDCPRSMLSVYGELIEAGLRIWVYRHALGLFTLLKLVSAFCDFTKAAVNDHLSQKDLINGSGDTDAVIPVTATRYSIAALNLKTSSPWRTWEVDGQVAGWVQEYEGLTFATVRGAGHEVPLHKPKEALTLFKSFLSGKLPPQAYTKVPEI